MSQIKLLRIIEQVWFVMAVTLSIFWLGDLPNSSVAKWIAFFILMFVYIAVSTTRLILEKKHKAKAKHKRERASWN